MRKEIEEAKSYFVLSQIFIILAGFLFASSGVVYSSVFNSFDKAVDIALSENMSNNLSQQLIQNYGDLTIVNISLYKTFLISAFIITFLSVLSWFFGNYKIKKIKNA